MPLSTTGAGNYSIEVPLFCGSQTVVVTFGAAPSCQREEISVLRTGCLSADIQITLSWDDKGRDFELHLIKAGGRINDNPYHAFSATEIAQLIAARAQGGAQLLRHIRVAGGPEEDLVEQSIGIDAQLDQPRVEGA